VKPVLVPLVSVLVFVAAIGAVPLSAADPIGSSAEIPGQMDDREAEFPITLTDATGTEITIDERPERVITTNPSAAQVMWELGAEAQVVGLTQFAHYLDGAESRTNISSTEQGVSIERVVGAKPDLVLAPNATSVETVEQLRDTGLTVYHFPQATDFDDVAGEDADHRTADRERSGGTRDERVGHGERRVGFGGDGGDRATAAVVSAVGRLCRRRRDVHPRNNRR